MVDFDYWFDNIVGTCKLIASRDAFERAWVLGDKTVTSAYDPDELFEQLLGDLHLEELVQHFADTLRKMGALETFATFASVFLDLERSVKSNPTLQDPKALLASQEWSECQSAAKRVIELPAVVRSSVP